MPIMFLTETNPNDVTGGGGDVSSVVAHPDIKGPFVVFPETDMENVASPHTVIAASTLETAYRLLHEGDPLAGGEKMDHHFESAAVTERPQRESREFDILDPADTRDALGR